MKAIERRQELLNTLCRRRHDKIDNLAFEFCVVVITEVGKERKNNLELTDVKGKAKEANQKNDLFNVWLKMCRHAATVDNFPLIKVVMDEQRAESWGADARIYNRFRYSVLSIEKKRYYLADYKIYRDRFSTDCFSDYFNDLATEFYEEIGAPKDCFYAIANRLLQDKGGIGFSELFNKWFDRKTLNAYKFTLPLNGEAAIKYSSVANIQAVTRYVPTIYVIG